MEIFEEKSKNPKFPKGNFEIPFENFRCFRNFPTFFWDFAFFPKNFLKHFSKYFFFMKKKVWRFFLDIYIDVKFHALLIYEVFRAIRARQTTFGGLFLFSLNVFSLGRSCITLNRTPQLHYIIRSAFPAQSPARAGDLRM